MARRLTTWLKFVTLAIAAGLSPCAFAQDEPATMEEVIVAMQSLDAESSRLDVWRSLQALSDATSQLANHRPSREDPQQEALNALADDHLSLLVSAYGKLENLRYYLRPLVELEMLRIGGPDLSRLDAIRLPDHASEEQAWVYIRDIVRCTDGQRRRSSSDPQVSMLRELGKQHMEVLLQTLEMQSLKYYAFAAIREAATEQHKALIIDHLLVHEQLISVVQNNGWSEDARDTIMLGLQEGVEYIPRLWMQSLAELEDPTTYDTLALALVRARCNKYYYQIVKDLPGIDLDRAVAISWEEVHTAPTHTRELREVSEIAAAHGHVEALEHLISLLPADDVGQTSRTRQTREIVLEHIDYHGSNAEIREWFDQYHESLRFSPESDVFYVAGGAG